MAIEFNCPYCTATIRTPDTSAGKTGRCPKCDTKIKIPQIAPPVIQPEHPQLPTEIPSRNTPVDSPLSTGDDAIKLGYPAGARPISFAESPMPAPLRETAAPSAASRYLKERRRRRSDVWRAVFWPAVGGMLLLAAVVGYREWHRPSFRMQLPGTRLDPLQPLAVNVSARSFQVSERFWHDLLESLQAAPVELRSNLLTVRFLAQTSAVSVLIQPGPESDLVRVPLSETREIVRFLSARGPELEELRLREMQAALDALQAEWEQHPDSVRDMMARYRDQFGINAHRNGLAVLCEAIVGDVRYPCVHADQQGGLVFVVPRGTPRFQVRERADPAGKRWFPSPLEIQVTVGDQLRRVEERPLDSAPPAEPGQAAGNRPDGEPRGQ